MPIYEYQCENGHSFEVLQKMDEPPLEKCQLCSGKAWRKISLSTQVKGAGVYLFDRKFGDRDVLHDPQFSDRERGEIVSEIERKRYDGRL
jgi:putative FmdB family regulatory protein